jgi:DNA polymerase III sliding clamp (beta) subunit (PCNA family)
MRARRGLVGLMFALMVVVAVRAMGVRQDASVEPIAPGDAVGARVPFRITVVDSKTGRGVPMVELTTVNGIVSITDSAGVIAFNEPGLMNQDAFFTVQSHGYTFPKDGFGFAGTRLPVTPGGSTTLKIDRANIAERLYRITDGETTLTTQVEAEGNLPPCVVPCTELLRRLRASKEPRAALAVRTRPPRLILNGGRVEHALPTLPVDDFPPVSAAYVGQTVSINAAELVAGLRITGLAVARETSRYAIDGVLLESDDQGMRLVATDGRRLVVVGLPVVESEFSGRVILPGRLVRLVEKLTEKHTDYLVLSVARQKAASGEEIPGHLFAAGPDWLLSTYEPEGQFPLYREVVPASASRFAVDRALFTETLRQVMLATGDYSRGVAVRLRPRSIELAASSAESGSAHAKLPARFLGGGDRVIHTGFNPDYLLEAVKTLPGDRVVLDVAQNGCGSDGQLFGKAALLYGADDPRVRWVLMPLNMGYPATQEYLGSNFKTEPAHAG